jgi:WG containing repeat
MTREPTNRRAGHSFVNCGQGTIWFLQGVGRVQFKSRQPLRVFLGVLANSMLCASLFCPSHALTTKPLKWAYINSAGKVVIKPDADVAHSFVDGLACVKDNRSGWGWIDKTGKRVIPCKFTEARDFSEGVATVKQQKWGAVDKLGNFVVPPQFEDIGLSFKLGMVAAKMNGKWGFVNATGKFVVPPYFEEVDEFHEGLAAVKVADRWGFINDKGESIFKPQAKNHQYFVEGRAAVENENNKWGFIDTHGNWVAKPIYTSVGKFGEGLAWAQDGRKSYFIDKDGEIVANFLPDVSSVDAMHEAFAGAYIQGSAGYVDRNARFVIKPQFMLVDRFENGVAVVTKKIDEKSVQGMIDRDGAVLLPLKYKRVHHLVNNLALVEAQPEHCGFVDKLGKLVIPDVYADALDFQENLAAVKVAK